ncbi:methyltransferase domain-containing protein [Gemmatimonadota bacterium]
MTKPQVDSSHYSHSSYGTKSRYASYWHQIDEILRLDPETTLEVGVGSSLVSGYLKGLGLRIVTCDIDPDLAPDVVGSVDQLPFRDASFDVVAAFQLLEHLPFERLREILGEFFRVSRGYLVLSLPDRRRFARLLVNIYPGAQIDLSFSYPRLFPPRHRFDGEHFWEIGKRGYPISVLKDTYDECGWELIRDYRVPEKPFHHFFILRRKDDGKGR